MKLAQQYRKDSDSLGEVKIPVTAYYGAQTQRAVENFQISGIKLPRSFIKAQGIIKASAAIVNMETGKLTKELGQAILQASEEVIIGKWDEHFVVDVYQAGAGTSQNMNANEIIANRASEILGGTLESKLVHANDHVNISQSTNDTFHCAMNMAAADMLVHRLIPSISQLIQELQKKSEGLMPIVKSGRTHLHDAVPIRVGQEFSGYADTIQAVLNQIERNLDQLYEIGLGGNAIGTKVNLDPQYIPKVIKEVCNRTKLPFKEPGNMFKFMQNPNAAIGMMLSLKELSIHLIKITSDLRLISSGPRTGLYEITLPSVQPGSTIMPGKVNPAILEMVHMVCCQVIGYETAIATAGMAGQLEINVMMPVIAYTLLQSIEIMSNALPTLVTKCIQGIQANKEKCRQLMESSLALVTGLSPSIGYDLASQIGLQADEENKTLEEVLNEKGLLTNEARKAIDPEGML